MSTAASEELLDEVSSINAIYGADTLVGLSTTNGLSTSSSSASSSYALTFPSHPQISLRIAFPSDYPSTTAPPVIEGPHAVGDDVAKGAGTALAQLAEEVLRDVFAGAPCVFELLEEVAARDAEDRNILIGCEVSYGNLGYEEEAANGGKQTLESQHHDEVFAEPVWVLSDTVTERKSVFLARVAVARSEAEVAHFRARLIATDKKAERATHNVAAWRVVGSVVKEAQNDGSENTQAVIYESYDDDGESAAGGRLLRLLESMDARNVLVVVSRWFGGVKLGADRFRFVNLVAKQALEKGDFVASASTAVDKKRTKGK